MISDFYASLPPTLDALPQSIIEDFDNLWYSVKDYHSYYDEEDVVFFADDYLFSIERVEMQLRYMCRLVIGRPGVVSFYNSAVRQLATDFEHEFMSWFAVRLIEVLVDYAGSTRLRQLRKEIAAEWDIVEKLALPTLFDPSIGRLLRFTFSVLVPMIASSSQPQAVAPVLQELKNTFASPPSRPKPVARPSTPPQALNAICHYPFSSKDVRELLQELGVIDNTGLWQLGSLTGKAAKPLSAFPAAYRALVEAGLMDRLDGPAWRKLFEEEFKVSFSNRLANYAWGGKTSLEFERYYNESKRWVSKRKAQ